MDHATQINHKRRRFFAGAAAATVTAVAASAVSRVAMAALPEPIMQAKPDTMPPLVPNTGRHDGLRQCRHRDPAHGASRHCRHRGRGSTSKESSALVVDLRGLVHLTVLWLGRRHPRCPIAWLADTDLQTTLTGTSPGAMTAMQSGSADGAAPAKGH